MFSPLSVNEKGSLMLTRPSHVSKTCPSPSEQREGEPQVQVSGRQTAELHTVTLPFLYDYCRFVVIDNDLLFKTVV